MDFMEFWILLYKKKSFLSQELMILCWNLHCLKMCDQTVQDQTVEEQQQMSGGQNGIW